MVIHAIFVSLVISSLLQHVECQQNEIVFESLYNNTTGNKHILLDNYNLNIFMDCLFSKNSRCRAHYIFNEPSNVYEVDKINLEGQGDAQGIYYCLDNDTSFEVYCTNVFNKLTCPLKSCSYFPLTVVWVGTLLYIDTEIISNCSLTCSEYGKNNVIAYTRFTSSTLSVTSVKKVQMASVTSWMQNNTDHFYYQEDQGTNGVNVDSKNTTESILTNATNDYLISTTDSIPIDDQNIDVTSTTDNIPIDDQNIDLTSTTDNIPIDDQNIDVTSTTDIIPTGDPHFYTTIKFIHNTDIRPTYGLNDDSSKTTSRFSTKSPTVYSKKTTTSISTKGPSIYSSKTTTSITTKSPTVYSNNTTNTITTTVPTVYSSKLTTRITTKGPTIYSNNTTNTITTTVPTVYSSKTTTSITTNIVYSNNNTNSIPTKRPSLYSNNNTNDITTNIPNFDSKIIANSITTSGNYVILNSTTFSMTTKGVPVDSKITADDNETTIIIIFVVIFIVILIVGISTAKLIRRRKKNNSQNCQTLSDQQTISQVGQSENASNIHIIHEQALSNESEIVYYSRLEIYANLRNDEDSTYAGVVCDRVMQPNNSDSDSDCNDSRLENYHNISNDPQNAYVGVVLYENVNKPTISNLNNDSRAAEYNNVKASTD